MSTLSKEALNLCATNVQFNTSAKDALQIDLKLEEDVNQVIRWDRLKSSDCYW